MRVSASEAVGQRFTPWPRQIKTDKNETGSFLTDARNTEKCEAC